MNQMMQYFLNMAIQKNQQQIANNPMAQEMIRCLQNGDSARGEELANNLCQSYGETKEQAVNHAQGFFQNMMGRH